MLQLLRRLRPVPDRDRRIIESAVKADPDLPDFPHASVQERTVGASGKRAMEEAARFAQFVRPYLPAPDAHLLDFGVGWGRIIRFFAGHDLHGVDVDRDLLSICEQTRVPGRLSHIEPRGKLPYDDNFFDGVYAYSVFSHLPQDVADHWVRDLARVSKPGAKTRHDYDRAALFEALRGMRCKCGSQRVGGNVCPSVSEAARRHKRI